MNRFKRKSVVKRAVALRIADSIFVLRLVLVGIFVLILSYFTYLVYEPSGAGLRNSVAVFASGAVLITVVYNVITYEYTRKKFDYDVNASRENLSFGIAMEWQKEFMTRNLETLSFFYVANKYLLDAGKMARFDRRLAMPENRSSYTALLVVLNFIESVCLGVKQGMMDEEFIKEFFQSQFVEFYKRYGAYIAHRRIVRHDPKIWYHFSDVVSKW